MRFNRQLFYLLLAATLFLSGCVSRTTGYVPSDFANLDPEINLSDIPFYPQRPLHCGPAALATAFGSQGKQIHPDQLATEVWTPGVRGSFAHDMVSSTRRNGLIPLRTPNDLPELLKLTADGHASIHLLNLAFNRLPQWHYAVLVGYDLERQEVLLRSGRVKERWMSFYHFERSRRLAGHWGIFTANPDNIPVLSRWQPLYQELINLQEVAVPIYSSALDTAINTYPSPWAFHYLAGNDAFVRNEFQLSAEHLVTAASMNAGHPLIWNNLAYAFNRMDCPADSYKALACAQSLAPDNQQVLNSVKELGLNAQSSPACMSVPECPQK